MALSPATAGAQSGRIVGVVADTTGAVLPGVTVTLYGGPGEPRISSTDGAGRFVFDGLPPGAYRLGAELSGFTTATVDGIAVAAGPVEVPVITLPLAGLSDTLVVTATRTEEPLQDVPMSLSAFSGADIERRDPRGRGGDCSLDPRSHRCGPGRAGPRRAHRARAAHRLAERVRGR